MATIREPLSTSDAGRQASAADSGIQNGAVRPTVRLLALLEATTVTGVAKNVLDFCRAARELERVEQGSAPVHTNLATFHRGPAAPNQRRDDATDEESAPNEFVTAARRMGVATDVIPEHFRFDPRVLGFMRRVVAERAPDIIATHNLKSHFLLRLSGLHRRYPWVAFHHGYTATNLKMRAYNRLNRWALPAAARVVTVCEAFARELADEGVPPRLITVLHNPIRSEDVAFDGDTRVLRERLGLEEGERVVLAVGRLSREKGHADLLTAFRSLVAKEPTLKATLVFVGEGPERPRLEEQAVALGINRRVRFVGQQRDVRPFYAAAAAMALPSHSEGSPYVLLEAMAARVPVVATRVGGVPEMVDDGRTALLVPARDTSALAEGIGRLLADANLARRIADNSADLAATRFAPWAYVRALDALYREVIADFSSCR